MDNSTLTLEAIQALKTTVAQTPKISKWTVYESVRLMQHFFSRSKSCMVTKSDFIMNGFAEYLPIVAIHVLGRYDTDFLTYVSTASQVHTGPTMSSYKEAIVGYEDYKQRMRGAAGQTAPTPNIGFQIISPSFTAGFNNNNNPARLSAVAGVYSNTMVLQTVLGWLDIQLENVTGLYKGCTYILEHLSDMTLIQSDLTYVKFPEVVKFFELDKYAAELCKFCFTFRTTELRFPRDIQNFTDRINQISEMTGVPSEEIMKYTAKNKKKFLPFVIETCSLQDNVWAYLTTEMSTSIENAFFSVLDTKDSLPREFFDGVDADNTEVILKLINASSKTKRPRHILLYGLPGTGKTSYMKLLCKLSGRKAFEIAKPINNSYNTGMPQGPNCQTARFMSILTCESKVDSTRSIIVVDEADNLLNCMMEGLSMFFSNTPSYSTESKALLNQIMDSVQTPVIWIANNPNYSIDPSCRRRFDYSIFFDEFNEKQRTIIWENSIKRYHLKNIPKDVIKEMASTYAITPGGISTACAALVDLAPSKKEVRDVLHKVIRKHCQLLGISDPKENKKFLPCKEYSLEGLNIESSIDIKDVTNMCSVYLSKLSKDSKTRPMNILLTGPSGTGKTEYVKYLGSVLNKPVEIVRASTMLDKYVGETEKNIARIFKHAEATGSILFLDEIDGLLYDRTRTHQSWEVSQVNEILCQMENFRGILIGASNFEGNLDGASVRRFTFKFRFKYLDKDGISKFYVRYFGKVDEKDEFFQKIINLSSVGPGDFSLVRVQADYTTEAITPEWVYKTLNRELEAKRNNRGLSDTVRTKMGY